MEFGDFIREGKVRKGSADTALARSLILTAAGDMEFLDTLEVTGLSARRLVCNYYDCLRSLLEAMAVVEGLRVYSHEAYAYYLKERKGEELMAVKFDRIRKVRNRLNYYGKGVSVEEARAVIGEIKEMINLLKKSHIRSV